jgi:2-dehydropantoate 2-reductase
MRIAIFGAGGVGGYFGARLHAAGSEVTFIARGAHAEAMRRGGLLVRSPGGEVHARDVRVVEDPAGPLDVVLLAVKLFDREAAAARLRPALAEGAVVVPVQNGIDSGEVLARVLGPDHAAAGVAYIAAVIEAPGVIRQTGSFAKLVFGELDGRESPRLEAFRDALVAAGCEAEVTGDIALEVWRKFVMLAPMAGATSLRRQPIGPLRDDPSGRALLEALVAETAAVGRARGVALPADIEGTILDRLMQMPDAMRTSMQNDLEAGRRLELDWLTGAVVREGERLGVPTPRSREVYLALAPFEDGG